MIQQRNSLAQDASLRRLKVASNLHFVANRIVFRCWQVILKSLGNYGVKCQVERLAMQMAGQIAEKRVQEAARSVKTLCEELEAATQQWLRQWQHETITLAIGITEKILARQIESDPSILISWIEDSVRLIQGQRQILLRIHPDDAQRLSTALSELVDDMKPSVEIQVVEDVAVGKFGVILQTPDTTIDRSLQTQLKRLVEELQ